MGFLRDIGKALFGDPGAGNDAQRESNEASQAYTREQAEQARNDAIGLYNWSALPLEKGYQAALDAIGGTTRQQIDTTARGNYFGQEALLAGMPQFQNAILGLSVDNSQLKPRILHPERNLDWMWNATPGQRSGGHAPMEGLAESESMLLNILQKSGMTNGQISNMMKQGMGYPQRTTPGAQAGAEAQAKALFDAGLLSGDAYRKILEKVRG